MANQHKYDKFTEEDIIQAQKSCYFQNNPQFDIRTPFPSLVHEIKPQGPNAFLEIHPPNTKEVFDPNFNLHYFKNDYNKVNMVYISRSYCGGFWVKEFNPIMAHFLLSQEEFEKTMKKIEKIAASFIRIKIFYIIFFLILILAIILIIVGSSSSTDPLEISSGDSAIFEFLDELSNCLIAIGLILIVFGMTFQALTVFCTLKKYEFAISKYLMKINQKKFLYRNIYWKIGSYCKFVQIQILPFTPQQFWMMQSQETIEHEKKAKNKN